MDSGYAPIPISGFIIGFTDRMMGAYTGCGFSSSSTVITIGSEETE
ncbi:MAG: hypothetical protein IJT54_00265 [Candidatus Methanomethylophilaceae archaeon]|nr:hypothetical protein [Candidatus Methanomethylophilaceae archaeon]